MISYYWHKYAKVNNDGFVKSPQAALRCILRRCGVPKVRRIPQYLRVLPAKFLQSRLEFGFCEAIDNDGFAKISISVSVAILKLLLLIALN